MAETTASPVAALAQAALAHLRRAGNAADGGTAARWQPAQGGQLDVVYRGPEMPDQIPDHIPGGIADAEMVLDADGWTGAHRLVVTTPLVVFDICWNPGEPVHIMTFSRGDWEHDVMAAAP